MTGGRRPPPPLRRRIAARLLLACCTLALGLGLGAAVAVVGVLDLQHPRLEVTSPGRRDGRLDRGVHRLFVVRDAPGGIAPLSDSRPECTVTELRSGRVAPAVRGDAGFAAVRVSRGGDHRVVCSSAFSVTVDVDHQGDGISAYLAAIGRGLVPAVALTVLAAVLAARALLAARRLGNAGT